VRATHETRCGATILMNSRDVITFVFFHNFGKCRWFARHQIVGAYRAHRVDEPGMGLDELKELLPDAPTDFQFRTSEHLRYSARTASVTYSLAGLAIARSSTVRCSPSGFRAAETRMLVSITSLSGIVRAFVFFRAWSL
jgi:hypothetical protein